jgi:hypothetical protein
MAAGHNDELPNTVSLHSSRGNQKVVDFEIVETENFAGTSQGMEPAAIRRMAKRWVNVPEIKYFVHDKDSHYVTVIPRKLNWPVIEKPDRNH